MVNTHPIWGKFPKIQAFLTECLELIIEKITIENKEIEQTVIDLIERQGKLLRPAYFFLFSQFGSAGPLPIASTPFGEFFIGLSYGFSIFASMVYINAFDVISFDWITTGQIITASIPTAITVMAILLANNICDLEEDIEDGRFTLPYHIGTDKALVVFKYFYYAAYIAVILSVIFATFPRLVTLSLLTFPYVLKNIRIFMKEQDKETTFMTTIINSVVIPVPIIITFFLGAWMGI